MDSASAPSGDSAGVRAETVDRERVQLVCGVSGVRCVFGVRPSVHHHQLTELRCEDRGDSSTADT